MQVSEVHDSRQRPFRAHSTPTALAARSAATRVLFDTLQRTVDAVRDYKVQICYLRGASSADIKLTMGELRRHVGAHVTAYHAITAGERARETAAVEAERLRQAYVEGEKQLYQTVSDLLEKIDIALVEENAVRLRSCLKAIETSLMHVMGRAIQLRRRVRNFRPGSA
ncbi:hypothetical protein AWB71_04492 [Caballeronia peredens]|nr:hypothetical protein AWB71_04492 [Caballeronia peredens]